jgi:hypothetical protein
MSTRILSSGLFFTSLVALFVAVGCSDKEESRFDDKEKAAGGTTPPTPLPLDPPVLPTTDAGPVQPACGPASLSGYTHTFKAPRAQANVCTPELISAFYKACLAQAPNGNACKAFLGANADCGACLGTDEAAASQGAVTFYGAGAYYGVNTAGCIAIKQKSSGDDSCAAAFDASTSCPREACKDCKDSNGIPASGCRSTAAQDPVCKGLITKRTEKCGDVAKDAATAECFQASGESIETIFKRVATLICGTAL